MGYQLLGADLSAFYVSVDNLQNLVNFNGFTNVVVHSGGETLFNILTENISS